MSAALPCTGRGMGGIRHVRLVPDTGGDEACPVSTGGGTRRVRLVRGGGGGWHLVLHARAVRVLLHALADRLRGALAKRDGLALGVEHEVAQRPRAVLLHARELQVGLDRLDDGLDAARLRNETCPISTGGGTRRVQLVREGGGGGAGRGPACATSLRFATQSEARFPSASPPCVPECVGWACIPAMMGPIP